MDVCPGKQVQGSVRLHVGERKTSLAIQPFLFNEDGETGIREVATCRILMCSSRHPPHFKNEWHTSEALCRPTTWEKPLGKGRVVSKPTNGAQGIPQKDKLLSDKKKSWSQKYDVWVFSKRQPVSADCSINASYPG